MATSGSSVVANARLNIRKRRGARLAKQLILREPLVAPQGIAQMYDDLRDEVRATIPIGSVLLSDRVKEGPAGFRGSRAVAYSVVK